MGYQIIQPPFPLHFEKLSKRELAEYWHWFHAVIDDRIRRLEAAVRENPSFENWRADFTRDSLTPLAYWFAGEVRTRRRTEEEIRELAEQIKYPFAIPREELTNETQSKAIDIGMYFGRVMERSHPQLEWTQIKGSKRNIHYGQPVLIGFGKGFEKVPLNPVLVAMNAAYGFVASKMGDPLRRTYDYWSKRATPMMH